MLEFFKGIVFGFFLLLLGQAYLIYLLLTLKLPQYRPPSYHQEAQATPQHILDYISNYLQSTISDTGFSQTFEFELLNLLLFRYFLCLRQSIVFRTKWASQVCDKLNAGLPKNGFVSRIDIQDLLLGEHCPRITGIRLVRSRGGGGGSTTSGGSNSAQASSKHSNIPASSSTSSPANIGTDCPITLDADIIYKGGLSLQILVVMSNGVFPIQVYMSEFSGSVRIRLPHETYPDMLSFAFIRDPGITFSVGVSSLSGSIRTILDKLLSNLLRRVFLDLFVLPSLRRIYLPLMDPKSNSNRSVPSAAPTTATAEQLTNQHSAVAKKDSSETKEGKKPAKDKHIGSTLVKGARLFTLKQKEETLGDAVPLTFDLSLAMPMYDKPVLETSCRVLVDAFMEFVLEPLKKDSGELEAKVDIPDSVYGHWKEIKAKNGISIQKKRIQSGAEPAELHRGVVSISCDASRVTGVLSNPQHLHHIHESFHSASVLYDEKGVAVHTCNFVMKGGNKSFLVLQVREPETLDESSNHAGTVIVMRSISGYKTDATTAKFDDVVYSDASIADTAHSSQLAASGSIDEAGAPEKALQDSKADGDIADLEMSGTMSASNSLRRRKVPHATEDNSYSVLKALALEAKKRSEPPAEQNVTGGMPLKKHKERKEHASVYLYGYYIQPSPSDPEESCIVTCISNLSPELSGLEIDFNGCKKLKAFIEELVTLTAQIDSGLTAAASGTIDRTSSSSWKIKRSPNDEKIEKLKNYIGTTANFFFKAKSRISTASSASEAVGQLKGLFLRREEDDGAAQSSQAVQSGQAAQPTQSNVSVQAGQGVAEGKLNSGAAENPESGRNRDQERDRGAASTIPAPPLPPRISAVNSPAEGESKSDDSRTTTARRPPPKVPDRAHLAPEMKAENMAKPHETQDALVARDSQDGRDSHHAQEQKDNHTKPIAPPPPALEKSQDKMQQQLLTVPDADAEFIEKPLLPKEIYRVDIRHEGLPGSVLSFEFMSILDPCPMFGIFYLPDIDKHQDDAGAGKPGSGLFLKNDGGFQTLMPLTECQSYTRPAHGSIPLFNLPPGLLILHFDNLLPLHKSKPKQIMYRAKMESLAPVATISGEWNMAVTIQRKTKYWLPVLIPEFLPSSPESQSSKDSCQGSEAHESDGKQQYRLYTSFQTNGDIQFSIQYAGNTVVSVQTSAYEDSLDLKQYIEAASSGTESDPKSQMMYLCWDNSESLVSSRQVTYRISIEADC